MEVTVLMVVDVVMVMDVVMALGVVMMRIKIHEVPAVNLNRREWQPISIGPRDVHGSDRIVGFVGSDRTGSDPMIRNSE